MTRAQMVTTTPTALAGITVDKQYSLQNLSSRPVRVHIGDTAPAVDAGAFVVTPFSFVYPKAESGEEIYIWLYDTPQTAAVDSGLIVYEESE